MPRYTVITVFVVLALLAVFPAGARQLEGDLRWFPQPESDRQRTARREEERRVPCRHSLDVGFDHRSNQRLHFSGCEASFRAAAWLALDLESNEHPLAGHLEALLTLVAPDRRRVPEEIYPEPFSLKELWLGYLKGETKLVLGARRTVYADLLYDQIGPFEFVRTPLAFRWSRFDLGLFFTARLGPAVVDLAMVTGESQVLEPTFDANSTPGWQAKVYLGEAHRLGLFGHYSDGKGSTPVKERNSLAGLFLEFFRPSPVSLRAAVAWHIHGFTTDDPRGIPWPTAHPLDTEQRAYRDGDAYTFPDEVPEKLGQPIHGLGGFLQARVFWDEDRTWQTLVTGSAYDPDLEREKRESPQRRTKWRLDWAMLFAAFPGVHLYGWFQHEYDPSFDTYFGTDRNWAGALGFVARF